MKITVTRKVFTEESTISDLAIDGTFFCYVLEDKVREVKGKPVNTWKIAGKTAIPSGTYKVIIDYSNRFKRDLPHLMNVEGFEGIRIHPGNYAKDTEGCLLLGTGMQKDMVTNSRFAFESFFSKLQNAVQNGESVVLSIY